MPGLLNHSSVGRVSTALCCPRWPAHHGAVAGGREALLVVAPLAAVSVGGAAAAVREPVAALIHRDWREERDGQERREMSRRGER